MYYILTVLLLAFGIYTLAGNFIDFPTKRTEKAMSAFRRGERFYTAITYPLTKIILKLKPNKTDNNKPEYNDTDNNDPESLNKAEKENYTALNSS